MTRALAIDPNFYAAHFAKAYVLMAENRTPEAVIEGERSLTLNPSYISAYVALCAANNFLGRPAIDGERSFRVAHGLKLPEPKTTRKIGLTMP